MRQGQGQGGTGSRDRGGGRGQEALETVGGAEGQASGFDWGAQGGQVV